MMGGLLRYLLIGVVTYVLYRVLKGWMQGASSNRSADQSQAGPRREVVDVMVQDPQCGVYLPQHEALRVVAHGQEQYFCSEACRNAYLAGPKENKNPES